MRFIALYFSFQLHSEQAGRLGLEQGRGVHSIARVPLGFLRPTIGERLDQLSLVAGPENIEDNLILML
jgi:hypothetical protein